METFLEMRLQLNWRPNNAFIVYVLQTYQMQMKSCDIYVLKLIDWLR